MKKIFLSAAVAVAALGYSAAAFANYYEVIGEGIGRDRDEAYEAASRDALEQCYRNWGESSQEQTILVEEVQEDTGYWYVKLSQGCVAYD